MITREEDADDLRVRMERDPDRWTSAVAILETSLAVARKLGWTLREAKAYVDRLLRLGDIQVLPIGAREGDLAVEAYARFGRGSNSAGLNLADCFAYACAQSLGSRLLFKGNDFTKTDVTPA